MDQPTQHNILLIGSGGNNPQVKIFLPASKEAKALLNLPAGHSAYAMDIEQVTRKIAVGTKGGLVFILNNDQLMEENGHASFAKLVQGAPVLSVCWVDSFHIAVSDTKGRCLLWDTKNSTSVPKKIIVPNGDICSMIRLPDGQLAGFSIRGSLSFWDPNNTKILHHIDINPPPPISALIQMVYWPGEQAIVCPCIEGQLALVDPETGDFKTLSAHNGVFYAITVLGNNLLTVGCQDNRLKIWHPGSDEPYLNFKIQRNVISAGASGFPPFVVLLVDSDGKAGVYTLEDKELTTINYLTGDAYRMVAFPSPVKMQALLAQQRSEELKNILAEIQEKIDHVPDEIIEGLHKRLVDLGFKHISLAIRSEYAEQKGEIVKAIKYSHDLLSLLPDDDPNKCTPMERYAGLLEKAWQILEADAILKKIFNIDPSYTFTVQSEYLERISEIMRGDNWIIEPDLSIDLIIQSATIINKRFDGRFVLNKMNSEPSGNVRLTPEMIVKKYEQVMYKAGKDLLPHVNVEQVWCISRKGFDKIDLLSFGNGMANKIKGLQFALQVLSGDLGTVFVPLVLFDWHGDLHDLSNIESNTVALKSLEVIRNRELSNLYLSDVHSKVKHAIRRLITEKQSVKDAKW